jgi:hypothetical protein
MNEEESEKDNINSWQNINAYMGERKIVRIGFEMTIEEALKEYGTKWQIPLNVNIIKH